MSIEKHGTPIKLNIVAHGSEEILAKFALSNDKNTITAKMYGEISRGADGTVDLSAEIEKHPEALWLRVKAIEADNENDNGDYFSREEIIKSYKTFEGVPVFTNHENQKVENAKGKVVLAEWDDEEGSVYCTMYIDREANPALCRAVEEGYVTDVSMGTQVDYSTCSVCGNSAYTADKYCDHVKTMKGRTVGGKKVYEENYGLKFIEISVVTDGACKDCTIREVLDPDEYKVAAEALVASFKHLKEVKTGLYKDSGQQEIELLNGAMDNIESVLRAMLDQRKYVDLEFMNNLTEVFADLQHVTDELVDQGYGSLPTAGQEAAPAEGIPAMPENEKEQGPAGPNPLTTGPSPTGIGQMTSPTSASAGHNAIQASSSNSLQDRLKSLQEKTKKIIDEIKGGNHVPKAEKNLNTISKLAAIWENPSVKSFTTEVSEGNYKIVVGKEEILGLAGGKKIASLKVADLDGDIRKALQENREATAASILDAFKGTRHASVEKTAESATADSEKQHEETMESQLRRENLELHPRENDVRQSITEKQFGMDWHGYDHHKQGLEGEPRHQITEKQMQEKGLEGYDYHAVQNDPREQIMEGQLRDESIQGNHTPAKSDMNWAAGVTEQNQAITENQLDKQWRKSDESHNPDHHITEKQLRDDQEDPLGRRVAEINADNAKTVLASSLDVFRRTAIATGATPDEMIEAVCSFSAEANNKIAAIKAAQSLDHPEAREIRANTYKRSSYYGAKVASSNDVIDYMLGSLSDSNLSPEVGLKALKVLAEQEDIAARIKEAIEAGGKVDEQPKPTTSEDLLRDALASNEDSDETEASIEDVSVIVAKDEINADPANKEAFASAAFTIGAKYASEQGVSITENIHVKEIDDQKLEVAMRGTRGVEASIEKEVKVAEQCDCDDACDCEGCDCKDCKCKSASKEDKLANRSQARKKLVEAQFGGQGGTTMPAPSPDMDPMADPAAPGAAPDPSMDQGIGSLTEDEGMSEEPDGDGEATPPGTHCPACTSEDVDVKGGKLSCNNCGSTGTISVNIEMDNWTGTSVEKGPGEEDMEDMDEGGIGDMAGGEGMEMPSVGLAMTYRLTPAIVKIAGNRPVGSVCPHCASTDVKIDSNKGSGQCIKCAGRYKIDVCVDSDTKEIIGRVAWYDLNIKKMALKQASQIKMAKSAAKSNAHKRMVRKDALKTALKAKGWTNKFANANLSQQADMIGALAEMNLIPKK